MRKHRFTMVRVYYQRKRKHNSIFNHYKYIYAYTDIACISEQLEAAQLLLKHGCDQTARDSSGETAIEQAEASFVEKLTQA